jgi:hypothetical protein
VPVVTGNGSRRSTPFSTLQWMEIAALIVVLWIQLALQFLFQTLLLSFLLGLVGLALLIHMATWLIPLWRAREQRRRS